MSNTKHYNHIHGHRRPKRSPTYISWQSIWPRCNDPNHCAYSDYGGRGIKVCDRWQYFTNFLEDMGERPEGKQLDREDNDGDYTPDNCRWITAKKNCRNRRNNRLITANGKTQCIAAWSEETGIEYNTIYARVKRYGWSEEKAVLTPGKKNNG